MHEKLFDGFGPHEAPELVGQQCSAIRRGHECRGSDKRFRVRPGKQHVAFADDVTLWGDVVVRRRLALALDVLAARDRADLQDSELRAALAGRLDECADVLHTYSENLGIAYQIRDDLDDLGEDSAAANEWSMRPSIILSLLLEMGKGATKDTMEALWNGQPCDRPDNAAIRTWAHESGAYEKATTLLESYKEVAIRSLQDVEIPNLKGLLRRVIGKIFNELEIKGWCREFEQKNLNPELRAEAAKAAEHLVPAPKV